METVIGVFPQTAREEIRVRLTELKGRPQVDFRIYASLEGHEDKLPTGKGFLVPAASFPEFKKTILDVETALLKQGLVPAHE